MHPYQVGGSLAPDSPSYVERSADSLLHKNLAAGEFCYVLAARQMGKSSLQLRALSKLQRQGAVCSVIDLSGICEAGMSPKQLYWGILTQLIQDFQLLADSQLANWQQHRKFLPMTQILNELIEQVLLVQVSSPIVIFFDEIDRLLSCQFPTDGFFAWIRACYNQRALKPAYRRLTFAILGVATISDLVRDKTQTPFNIGCSIQLQGLQADNAVSLTRGFAAFGCSPEQVLEEILFWTGGQPFLTQKLCQVAWQAIAQPGQALAAADNLSSWLADLVQSHMIEMWQLRDVPQHFRTIRDRVLKREQRLGQLLGLYQKILHQSQIPADGSAEQTELLLSGLAIKQLAPVDPVEAVLCPGNRIYASIFNQQWVEQHLANLRPYADQISAWFASGYRDESQLLRGPALRDAQAWAAVKNLGERDYQFLAASEALEKRKVQRKLAAEREFSQNLWAITQKISFILLVTLTVALATSLWTGKRIWRANKLFELTQKEVNASRQLGVESQQLEALLAAMASGQSLQSLANNHPLTRYPTLAPLRTLRSLLDSMRLRNQVVDHPAVALNLVFSPDGRQLTAAFQDGTLQVWRRQDEQPQTFKLPVTRDIFALSASGNREIVATIPDAISPLTGQSLRFQVQVWMLRGKSSATFKQPSATLKHDSPAIDLSVSPDGQRIVTVAEDNIARLWQANGELIKALNSPLPSFERFSTIRFSRNGRQIMAATEGGKVQKWDASGELLDQLTLRDLKPEDRFLDVSFSEDGEQIVTVTNDGIVQLWNSDGTLVRTLTRGILRSILVSKAIASPDGQQIATIAINTDADTTSNLVQVWNWQGQRLAQLNHQEPVAAIQFSPDGKQLATIASNGTIQWWDINPKTRQRVKFDAVRGNAPSNEILDISFSPDGAQIAVASDKTAVKFWKANGMRVLGKSLQDAGQQVSRVQFSADGEYVATASVFAASPGDDLRDRAVKLWNLKTGERKTLNYNFSAFDFSPNQPLSTKTILGKLRAGASFWRPQAKNLAKPLLAIASDAGQVLLLDRNGNVANKFSTDQRTILAIRFRPDGRRIATVSDDGFVRLWTLKGKLAKEFQAHSSSTRSLSFSTDGQFLATADDSGEVGLWRTNGKLIRKFQAHRTGIREIHFNVDGQLMATIGAEGTVRLWNRKGDLFQEFRGGSNRRFLDISFSPKKNELALASADGTVEVWPIEYLDTLLERGCVWLQDYFETNPKNKEAMAVRRQCKQLPVSANNATADNGDNF